MPSHISGIQRLAQKYLWLGIISGPEIFLVTKISAQISVPKFGGQMVPQRVRPKSVTKKSCVFWAAHVSKECFKLFGSHTSVFLVVLGDLLGYHLGHIFGAQIWGTNFTNLGHKFGAQFSQIWGRTSAQDLATMKPLLNYWKKFNSDCNWGYNWAKIFFKKIITFFFGAGLLLGS